MASWMVHLRVADALLHRLPKLSEEEFIMGNIAPDSGVPSADWSYYVPSSEQSHYKTTDEDGMRHIGADTYAAEYFTREMQSSYTQKQYSFYLGYLTHLLTDILWNEHVWQASKKRFIKEAQTDENALLWKCKKDWYDLDHLYIREHQDFRAFQIYRNIQNFENTYMELFSRNAFLDRQSYIVNFYTEDHKDLDREYPYFTKQQAEEFVKMACESVWEQLKERYL